MRKSDLSRMLLCCEPAACLSAAGDTTRIHIHVVNDLGKPVGNAEVIVKFLGIANLVQIKKKESWELRTTQEGTVSTPGNSARQGPDPDQRQELPDLRPDVTTSTKTRRPWRFS